MTASWQLWRDRRGRLSPLRAGALALLLLPLAKALVQANEIAHGARPLNELIHRAGFWALVFLGLTLAVTPFRRVFRYGNLVDIRRMLGVGTFATSPRISAVLCRSEHLPDRYVKGTCPVCSNPDARGDQCENCGTYLNQTEGRLSDLDRDWLEAVVRPTKHWYFALSRFQKPLEEYIESHRKTWKDNVIEGARSWLKTGLGDCPITRDLSWGIPVPLEGTEGKVLYVWFDAPIGDISATKRHVVKNGRTGGRR